MGLVFARIGSVSATLFLAFILATAMLVTLGLYAPDWLNWIINGAELVEDWLTHTGLPNRYNNFVRIFLGDEQITFLFFTIFARILIAIVATSFSAAFFPGKDKRNFVEKTFG
tara:strand:+ start:155 stop:493 length:339 start_codon:yes stop_codon:yes gene_type:complete